MIDLYLVVSNKEHNEYNRIQNKYTFHQFYFVVNDYDFYNHYSSEMSHQQTN